MKIPKKTWDKYIKQLSRLNYAAGALIENYIEQNGIENTKALTDYAFSVIQKYGNGSAALSAAMYDALAAIEGAEVAPAVMADLPDYGEVAKTVYGTLKTSQNPSELAGATSRLVKRMGADTTLKNAQRDKAQFAWVPAGDTCAFCLTLASRGWQNISKLALKNGHAEHIHANCDCTYAVRFNHETEIAGYNPEVYKEMYDEAEGKKPKDKINTIRRMQYEGNKDRINAQKRQNYAERNGYSPLSNKRTDLLNEYVIKSVGAKGQNYDIMDLQTGEMFHLAEGSHLQDKEVFAGKGSTTEFRNASKYADKYGGNAEDWQHVKAKGTLSTNEGDRKAEIHWSQCEGIGKQEMFVKRWLDE